MKLALKLLIHFGSIFLLSILLSHLFPSGFEKEVNKVIQEEHRQIDKFIFEHLQQH